MKERLTTKEARFLKEYLKGSRLGICAKRAGYKCKSSDSFNVVGCQVLKSLNLTMRDHLELNGVTDELATRTLTEGLKATRPIVATFQGRIGDVRNVPDPATRGKFLEIYSRWKGLFVDKVELSGAGGGDIELVISSSKQKKKATIDL